MIKWLFQILKNHGIPLSGIFVLCMLGAILFGEIVYESNQQKETVSTQDTTRVADPQLDSLIREEKRVKDSTDIVLRKKESIRLIEARRASVRDMTQEDYEEMVRMRDEIEDRIKLFRLRRELIELQKKEKDLNHAYR